MRRFKAVILCLTFTAVLCCGMVGASTRASNYLVRHVDAQTSLHEVKLHGLTAMWC